MFVFYNLDAYGFHLVFAFQMLTKNVSLEAFFFACIKKNR
jgi:hypothetical protein